MHNVVIDIPEVPALKEMASVCFDLKSASGALKRAIQVISLSPIDGDLISHLYTSAICRYVRAFATGVRTEAQKLISAEVSGSATHLELIRIRNQAIAHSVNGSEGSEVQAHLMPQSMGSPMVLHISVRHERELFPGIGKLEQYLSWIEKVASIASVHEARLKEQALETIRTRNILAVYKSDQPTEHVLSVEAERSKRRE